MKKRSSAEPAQKGTYRRYSVGLQVSAVERMKLGGNVSALARELAIPRGRLYDWKNRGKPARETVPGLETDVDVRNQHIRDLEAKVAALEGELGRAGLEVRFFKGALRRIGVLRLSKEDSGVTASTPKSAARRKRKVD